MENFSFKRFLSLVMAFVMVLSYVPANAFAAEGDPSDIVAEEPVVEEPVVEEPEVEEPEVEEPEVEEPVVEEPEVEEPVEEEEIPEEDNPPHEHDYKAVVTAPTCTEGGYTTYTCACEDSYTADEVDALGHKYEAVVTAPTCTEGGYTTYTCACEDSYTADEVDALGHKPGEDGACTVCGAKPEKAVVPAADQVIVTSEDELMEALFANETNILFNADLIIEEDNELEIPEGVTVTFGEGYKLINNGTINGTVVIRTMVYTVEERDDYDITATMTSTIEGTVPAGLKYEISLDGGNSWFEDTTNGKAQAVTVKADGSVVVSASFQSAFTSALTGDTVHMLKDAHVQSTNTKKNNGPLRSYYGLILEGNGHTIYTDLESSGASNEYATIKFTSYLAGTGPEVNPVLKNVTIDSQNNAKADLDFVSGDVTFTVTMYNVNLLGNCQNASFPVKSNSTIINKSVVEIYDCTIPSWDANSAKAIDLYSGNYSLSLNNKCTVYGGTYTKDVTNYLADGFKLEKINGKYVVTENPSYGKVAMIGDTYYDTLAAAVAAAQTGDIITLLADTDEAVKLPLGVTLNKENFTAENVTETVAVAMNGTTPYESLTAAITAAQPGDTIILLGAVTENITIDKNLTIDGASVMRTSGNATYTGTMTLGSVTATIQNIDFVNGEIVKTDNPLTGDFTIKNCTFTGKTSSNYAIKIGKAHNLKIEGCEANGIDFLYVPYSLANLSVKDVTIKNASWGIHLVSINEPVFENVIIEETDYAIVIQNTGNKKVTLKNCEIDADYPVVIWEKESNAVTMMIQGVNDFGAEEWVWAATNKGPAENPGSEFANVVASAQIGTKVYGSFAKACEEVQTGETIKLLANVNNAEINKAVSIDVNGKSASFVLTAEGVLTAPEGLTVTTNVADHEVEYANGKYIVVETAKAAAINGVNYKTLQAAIDAAVDGDTITLLADCAENVTFVQAPDVKVTFDGAGMTMTGTITVNGKSAAYPSAGLTIQNVNFVAATDAVCINLGVSGNNNTRYTSNVTVDNCTFTGNGKTACGIKSYTGGDKNLTVTNCTATGMHSLMQLKNVVGVTVSGVTITDSKNGISVGESTNIAVTNANISTDGYGIRADGKSSYKMTVSDSKITADLPVVVRYATGAYNLTVNGENEFVADNDKSCGVVITNGDDGTFDAPTGDFNVQIEDKTVEVFPGYTVMVGEGKYHSLADAITAAEKGDTITFLADITEDVTINKNLTIDGAGKTYTGTMTISTKSITATVKNVNFDGAANTKPYAIKSEGAGSSLVVENCNVKDYLYSFLYVRKGMTSVSVKDVAVENCPSYAVYFASGVNTASFENLTVKNSNNGFIIDNSTAARKLTIKNVTMENVATAINHSKGTKTITCTANGVNDFGTANISEYVTINAAAKIGNKFYESVAAAVDAAVNGDTITLLADCAENITFVQAPDVQVTFDGADKTMTGTITVNGKSSAYPSAGLTIKNVNFVAATDAVCINLGVSGDNNTRYTSNVTVENCTFTGTDKTACGIKSYTGGDKNLTVKGCTATGMHSLMQLKNVVGVTVSDVTITGSKNGISVGESTNIAVTNANISTDGYGIRADGKSSYEMTVTGGAITANLPIVVRKTSGDYQLTVSETTLTVNDNEQNSDKYQVILTAGDDGEALTRPTSAPTVELSENIKSYPADAPVAKIDSNMYNSLPAAIEAANAAKKTTTITLLESISGPGVVIDSNVNVTIDFAGYKYTITEPATDEGYGFMLSKVGKAVTLKNGTLQVAENAGVRILVQNFANLTVTDMKLDGTYLTTETPYVLSNNSGTVKVNGATEFTVKEGGIAFDACQVEGFALPTVQVSDSVTINGIPVNQLTTAEAAGAEKYIDAPAKYSTTSSGGSSTYYATLQQAVKAKTSIVMLKDYAATDLEIAKSGSVTIDLNEKTLTLKATGDNSVGIQTSTGAVTLKNGTLHAANTIGTLFEPKAKLTINNVAITGNVDSVFEITPVEGAALPTVVVYNDVTVNGTTVDQLDEANVFIGTVAKNRGTAYTTYYVTLQQAVEAATSVMLVKDVTLGWDDVTTVKDQYPVLVNMTKATTLDLNGHKIKVNHSSATDRIYAVIYVADTKKVTVKDSVGTGGINVIANANTPKVAYMFWKDGTTGYLNIESGNYHMNNSEDSMVYTNGTGIVNVKGGTWILDAAGSRVNGFPHILNTEGKNSKYINVSGGYFSTDIAHQFWANEVAIAAGKAVKKEGDLWTLSKAVACIEETAASQHSKPRIVNYATLADAIASAKEGATITLLSTVTFEDKVNVEKSVTITPKSTSYKIQGELVLANESVTLTAPKNLNVTSAVKNTVVKYADGAYKVADAVAKTGDGKLFGTLEEAVAYANANLSQTTITLLKNAEVAETLVIDTAAIKVLGTKDKTIKSTADVAIQVAKGTKSLYIRGTLDTSAAPEGSVAIQVETAATVKIDSSAAINAGGNVALKLIKSAKEVNITDAKVNAGQFIVSDTNGTATVEMEGATINVNGSNTAAIEIYGGKLLVTMAKDQAKDKCTIKVSGQHVVYVAADSLDNYNGVIDFADQTGFLDKYQYLTVSVDAAHKKYVADVALNTSTKKTYMSLADAIAEAKSRATVKLLTDIKVTKDDVVAAEGYNTIFHVTNKTLTVDLNGKTITADAAGMDEMLVGVFFTSNNGKLTLTGNGTINATANGANVYGLLVNFDETSYLTIKNGTYTLDEASDSLLYTSNDGKLIVEDGTFRLGNVGEGPKGNGSPWIFNGLGKNTCNVVVKGGNFNADINHQYWCFEVEMPKDKALKEENGIYTVVDAVAYVTEREWSSKWYTRNVGYATLGEAFDAAEGVKVKVSGGKEIKSTKEDVYILSADIKDVVIPEGFAGRLVLKDQILTSVTAENEADILIYGNVTVNNPNGSAITGKVLNITGSKSELTAIGNGDHAYGIGGDNTKKITISSVNIAEVRGGHDGEIGTDTKWYKDAPEGGAAIGSAYNGAEITLKKVNITKAVGGSKAAGIGAKYHVGVTVNIDDCNFEYVEGGATAAAIGGSRVSGDAGENPTTINIDDSVITAVGGVYGAGIGSGYDTHCLSKQPLTTINIQDSTINATGGQYAAGVGTGYHNAALAGVIKNSTVNAVSGEKSYKDTYTKAQDIGFGVVDPAREGQQTDSKLTYNGKVITIPPVREQVAEGLEKDKNGAYFVTNAEGLANLNAKMIAKALGTNVVVNLDADIDFSGKTWTPVDSHADSTFTLKEINGNGHTISNMTVNGQAMFTRFAGSGDVVIKNITFDKATVNSDALNTSILTVQTYQNVLLDNVDVKNSSITGAYKVAPLIATVYNEKESTITATLKNCDVENVTVKSTQYDFFTTGMVAWVSAGNNDKIEFENCTVKDVKLYGPTTYGYKAHAAIYTTDTAEDCLFNEAEGVTVTNVTFENI